MLSLTAPAILAILFAQVEVLASDQAAMSYCSYAFKKQYICKITGSHLAKSPKWSDDAENPPLAAKKAIDLATKMKDSLVKDGKQYKWELDSLELRQTPFSRWLWVAKYQARFQGMSTGIPHELDIVVMMDGTVIKPEVLDVNDEPDKTPNSN